MNEISSWVHGSREGCPGTTYDDPPYLPGNSCHSNTFSFRFGITYLVMYALNYNRPLLGGNLMYTIRVMILFFSKAVLYGSHFCCFVDVVGGTLYYLNICPSAPQNYSLSYDVHSLYGLMETNATYR